MPANLPPVYRQAEKRLRAATGDAERMQCLERMLELIPRHKGTEKLQADLRTRLKVLRERTSDSGSNVSGEVRRFPREGFGRLVLCGPVNSGRTRVFNVLTGAGGRESDFPYATREVGVGMFTWGGLDFQVMDTPPLEAEQLDPQLEHLIRSADIIGVVVNGKDDDSMMAAIEIGRLLISRNILLPQNRQRRGGAGAGSSVGPRVVVILTHSLEISAEAADLLEECGFGRDAILATDLSSERNDLAIAEQALRDLVAGEFGVIRVWTQRKGEAPDLDSPIGLPEGSTVADLAASIHGELAKRMTDARIRRRESRECRIVGREAILQDDDIVEIRTR